MPFSRETSGIRAWNNKNLDEICMNGPSHCMALEYVMASLLDRCSGSRLSISVGDTVRNTVVFSLSTRTF